MFDPYAELLENEWFDEYASDDYSYDNDSMYFEDGTMEGKTRFQDITDKVKTAIELLIAKIKMKVEEIMAKVSSIAKDLQQKMVLKKMQRDIAKSDAPENRMVEVSDVWSATNFWKANSSKLWSLCDDFFTKDYKDIRSMESDTTKLKDMLLNIENKIEALSKKKKKMTLKQFQEFLKIEATGNGNIRKVQKEVNEHLMKLKAKNEYLAKKAEILQKNNMMQYAQPDVKRANAEKGKIFSERGKRALSIISMVGFTTLKIVSVLYVGMTIINMIGGAGGPGTTMNVSQATATPSGGTIALDPDYASTAAVSGGSGSRPTINAFTPNKVPTPASTDALFNSINNGFSDFEPSGTVSGSPRIKPDISNVLSGRSSGPELNAFTPNKVPTDASTKALFNSINKKLPGFENITHGSGARTSVGGSAPDISGFNRNNVDLNNPLSTGSGRTPDISGFNRNNVDLNNPLSTGSGRTPDISGFNRNNVDLNNPLSTGSRRTPDISGFNRNNVDLNNPLSTGSRRTPDISGFNRNNVDLNNPLSKTGASTRPLEIKPGTRRAAPKSLKI